MLNGALWNRQITRKNKLQIYRSIAKSTVTYGAQKRRFNKTFESKLISMEMDLLGSPVCCSTLKKKKKINGLQLEEEEKEDLEIRGCRK